MSEILQTKNLCKTFTLGTEKIEVLKDVNFSVQKGDCISIVGASGVGKSTLLHLLGALDRPTQGEVIYHGKSIFSLDENGLAKFRNRHIGFVFQFHHLLPEFSALENVMMPVLISGENQKNAQSQAQEILSELGLKDRLNHKPGELSGGEQQRVAIARALVMKPSVLFADELTGNLDLQTSEKIESLLFELNQKYQMTMLIVTHNEKLAQRCPIQYRLQNGVLLC